ncbi:hypothetical protein ABE957_10310 [Halomonas sp. CS7]|uniref:Uncharacterized protein n=1 Tax=Halomonas pelophila TaxID=3151122 RepID=A0ABV1N5Q4_9GAMM
MAAYQFGKTGTAEQVAALARMIQTRKAPLGVANFQAHTWCELLVLTHFPPASCIGDAVPWHLFGARPCGFLALSY